MQKLVRGLFKLVLTEDWRAESFSHEDLVGLASTEFKQDHNIL